jgi:hypothetical protein
MAKAQTKAPSNKLGQIVTPIGSALFVSCPNASAFDENKQEATIVLSAEDYAVFKRDLDALIKDYDGKLVVDPDKMTMPVKPAEDADGNPTGEYMIKAKTAMKYPARLYNAKGGSFNPPAGFQVANRSKIRLQVSAELISTNMFKGLVLRLNAVQIISSTPWAGNSPFGATDGDFTGSDVVDGGDDQGQDDDWV